jgi:hypothetical protein
MFSTAHAPNISVFRRDAVNKFGENKENGGPWGNLGRQGCADAAPHRGTTPRLQAIRNEMCKCAERALAGA